MNSQRSNIKGESICRQTASFMTTEVISLGQRIRKKAEEKFGESANGKHFYITLLSSCLLPTLGFHVLSRTGHTNFVEAFLFKISPILYGSNHLKYQQVFLYYSFIRSILPEVAVDQLFLNKPGKIVAQLPTFTSHNSSLKGKGWSYVHLDESLEMLIVRALKRLSVNVLPNLGNAASWLLPVSHMRSLLRRVAGSASSYSRVRGDGDLDESNALLKAYDRNKIQWKTVSRILHVMREVGFLNGEHLSSEWIVNVFSNPPKRMNSKSDQKHLLQITDRGKKTAELHASAVLPDVFGSLSKNDIEIHFGNHRFKKWTSKRKILTPRQSMEKVNGSVTLGSAGPNYDCLEEGNEVARVRADKRPSTQELSSKILADRRRVISKAKDNLHLIQTNAKAAGNDSLFEEASKRWDSIHEQRWKVSIFADALCTPQGEHVHPSKFRFLKVSERGEQEVCYTFESFSTSESNKIQVSRPLNNVSYKEKSCFALQVDLMNCLHYSGVAQADRGTTIYEVVTGKIKSILLRWLHRGRCSWLRQIHFHIDDPAMVLPHKSGEQVRRDNSKPNGYVQFETNSGTELPSFQSDLCIPWIVLMRDRDYKDQLACLHLFCAAQAANELFEERGIENSIDIYLHGGHFAVSEFHLGKKARFFSPVRTGKGHVLLIPKEEDHTKVSEEEYLADVHTISRNTCLIFSTESGLRVGNEALTHGESESRFVAAFETYVRKPLQVVWTPMLKEGASSCLILSDDTDVFVILILAGCLKGYRVMHCIKDSLYSLDQMHELLDERKCEAVSLGYVYAFSGSDYTPGTFGIPHDVYIYGLSLALNHGIFDREKRGADIENEIESVMCCAYLWKNGVRKLFKIELETDIRQRLSEAIRNGTVTRRHVNRYTDTCFFSKHDVGSLEWTNDVRRLIADKASNVNELMPCTEYIRLQARRAIFLVTKYWARAFQSDLSPAVVGGTSIEYGYTAEGQVVLETVANKTSIRKDLASVIQFCACRKDCSTRLCSCLKKGLKCLGCRCDEFCCKNREEPKTHGEESKLMGGNKGNDHWLVNKDGNHETDIEDFITGESDILETSAFKQPTLFSAETLHEYFKDVPECGDVSEEFSESKSNTADSHSEENNDLEEELEISSDEGCLDIDTESMVFHESDR